jgi:tRNA (cmo5U34)-methyltransferase
MPDKEKDVDRLFQLDKLPGDFVFDEKVTRVFEDMINRSVPGYSTIVAMIGVLADRYLQAGSRVYDLGCSLGGASFAICESVAEPDYDLIAIDNSPAMIEKFNERLAAGQFPHDRIETRLEDINQSEIEDASVVVLNFTLQFLDPTQRQTLIQRIYDGMRDGGILLISEKILFPDTKLNELFIELYHGFKESMGYSRLEISRKRTALENVLIPESLDSHRQRLAGAGFRSVDVWFQCFNFASLVAFKQQASS